MAISNGTGRVPEVEPEHASRGIGVDWWATIVAGALVALAVANLLPKIPW